MTAKPEKPRYGDACNQCGICCLASQCDMSKKIFGIQTVCPALTDAGTHFDCGLIVDPAKYFIVPECERAEYDLRMRTALGVGTFCDAVHTQVDQLRHSVLGDRLMNGVTEQARKVFGV